VIDMAGLSDHHLASVWTPKGAEPARRTAFDLSYDPWLERAVIK